MSVWWIFTIVWGLIFFFFLLLTLTIHVDFFSLNLLLSSFIIFMVFLFASILQPISLENEMIYYNKERQQILYHIESLTDNSDKIQLNEMIFKYNDWVDSINANKEIFGWFSWYDRFEMSKHTHIELV